MRHRPSSQWRNGFMLYDGWPAQEGGTDCRQNERRSTHSLLSPAVVLDEVAVVAPPAPSTSASWAARYPAWWTEAAEAHIPAIPAETAPPTRVVGFKPNYPCADTAPAQQPPCPPQTQDHNREPVTAKPPPPPQQQQPRQSAEMQTQTDATRRPPLRSPLMPCMRPTRTVAAPAASKVGSTLRKEAALRKQLVAARRRRLEAVVSGSDPQDAPIDTVRRSPRAAALAAYDRQLSPSGSAREAAGEAAGEAASEAAGERIGEATVDAAGARLGDGEDIAQAAIDIAQRFLGSSLGGYFLDAAQGAHQPRAFSVHEHEESRPTAAAELRVARAAASVAAIVLDRNDSSSCGAGELVVGAEAGEQDAAAVGEAREWMAAGKAAGYEEESGAQSTAAADDGFAAFADFGADAGDGAPDYAAIDAAVARFGLHETVDEDERRAAASGMRVPPPPSQADWMSHGVTGNAEPAFPAAEVAAVPRAPSVWEVDIAPLRGKAPPPAEEARPRRSERMLRPRPAAGGRRSHAGWSAEFELR